MYEHGQGAKGKSPKILHLDTSFKVEGKEEIIRHTENIAAPPPHTHIFAKELLQEEGN